MRAAGEEQITHAMVVPTMLSRILDEIERTATALPGPPARLVRRRAHAAAGDRAGDGHAARRPLGQRLRPDRDQLDHRRARPGGPRRPPSPATIRGSRARLGSVGRPLPSLELEIRDPDGTPCPPGEKGEIYVRGEQVAGEYLGRSALTDDGWFPTNDGGYLDEDGYLFLEGRLDDVIVRGGENISPGEIEDMLVGHPAVAEAAVVGMPDDEWGEKVVAAVVLQPGAEVSEPELQDWVRTPSALDEDAGTDPVPRRAAAQRDRQAPAPRAQGRARRQLSDAILGDGAGQRHSIERVELAADLPLVGRHDGPDVRRHQVARLAGVPGGDRLGDAAVVGIDHLGDVTRIEVDDHVVRDDLPDGHQRELHDLVPRERGEHGVELGVGGDELLDRPR